MARITVEDCLDVVPNRFSLCLLTAERTKQLMKGARALIADDRENKEIVTALREIAAGVVLPDLSEFDENMLLASSAGRLPPREHSGDELPPDADDELPPEAD